MKGTYSAFGGRLIVEVQGETVKDLFAAIGEIAEVLDADATCGKCQSAAIYPRARSAQSYTYYELCCSACQSRLQFGQHKTGDTLFPKRTDEHGQPLPYRGWSKYEPGNTRPSSARPSPGVAPDEALHAYIAESRKGKQAAEAVIAEICDAIVQIHGEAKADAIWREALRGNPTNDDLIRRLYAKIKGGA